MPNWEEEAHDDDQHGYGYMVGATLPALLLTINEFILLQSNYHQQGGGIGITLAEGMPTWQECIMQMLYAYKQYIMYIH